MAKFNVRLINLGHVENTGSMNADSYRTAFNDAHPPVMDPMLQCALGNQAKWIEITPNRPKVNQA